MTDEVVIKVNDVHKSFKMFYDRGHSLKEVLLFKNRRRYERHEVLKGVSFEVRKGEAVGLIGHNGCGKSTMLKLLSRIMYPNKGSIEVKGRVSSLIELAAGFHPDMSGRENIYINASIFGLSKKEIDERLQTIIDFSEIEEFIDNPVRTYSSGMYMRLAFSVAINVDADVLLIDEILAVGDVSFQTKCFNKLHEIKADGTTIVIVSHSLAQIEQICETSYWIDDGLIRESGTPKIVHEHYLKSMELKRIEKIKKDHAGKSENSETEHKLSNEQHETLVDEAEKQNTENTLLEEQYEAQTVEALPEFCDKTAIRMGNGDVKFTGAEMRNASGDKQYVFKTGEKITVHINYESSKPGIKGNFGYGIFRDDSLHCYGTNVMIESGDFVPIKSSGTVEVTFDNLLLPGKYFLDVAVHSPEGVFLDDIRRIQSFVVTSDKYDVGVGRLASEWTVDGKKYKKDI